MSYTPPSTVFIGLVTKGTFLLTILGITDLLDVAGKEGISLFSPEGLLSKYSERAER